MASAGGTTVATDCRKRNFSHSVPATVDSFLTGLQSCQLLRIASRAKVPERLFVASHGALPAQPVIEEPMPF
jgi:hypothetical protein